MDHLVAQMTFIHVVAILNRKNRLVFVHINVGIVDDGYQEIQVKYQEDQQLDAK